MRVSSFSPLLKEHWAPPLFNSADTHTFHQVPCYIYIPPSSMHAPCSVNKAEEISNALQLPLTGDKTKTRCKIFQALQNLTANYINTKTALRNEPWVSSFSLKLYCEFVLANTVVCHYTHCERPWECRTVGYGLLISNKVVMTAYNLVTCYIQQLTTTQHTMLSNVQRCLQNVFQMCKVLFLCNPVQLTGSKLSNRVEKESGGGYGSIVFPPPRGKVWPILNPKHNPDTYQRGLQTTKSVRDWPISLSGPESS